MRGIAGRVVTGLLILIMIALLVVMGFMLVTIARGESPRQKAESGQTLDQLKADRPSDSQQDVDNTGKADDGGEPKSLPDVLDVPVPTPQPAANSPANLGDYYVDIKEASAIKDFDGNPAIIVTYEWTNNSGKAVSAKEAFDTKAYQDGIRLENALVMGSDKYNFLEVSKEIQPGTALQVQNAFVLADETAPVTFELAEAAGVSTDKAVMDFDPSSLS